MSFTRARLPGFWTIGSTILATDLEHIDDYAYAIDGRGGTYAPASLITIGGSGLTVSGEFNASNAQSITLNNLLTISGTGLLNIVGNATAQSGALVTFASGSQTTMQGGSMFMQNVGSTGSFFGTNTFNGTTTFAGAVSATSSVTCANGLTVTQSSSNANAIIATGNGTGAGLAAVPGVTNTASAPTKAAQFAGYIAMIGTDPDATVTPSTDNPLYGIRIAKALGTTQIVPSIGGPYNVDDTHNVASIVDVSTGVYEVTFLRAMSSAFYTVTLGNGGLGVGIALGTRTASSFRFTTYDTNTKLAVAANIVFCFSVFSRG
jgi:hypothetical protein